MIRNARAKTKCDKERKKERKKERNEQTGKRERLENRK